MTPFPISLSQFHYLPASSSSSGYFFSSNHLLDSHTNTDSSCGSIDLVVVVGHDVLKVVLTGETLLVSQNLDLSGGMGRYRREDGRMGDGNLGLGGLLGLRSSSFSSSSFGDRFG